MKPEEFDEVFRNKINQLTRMPGLECTDDRVWQKVKINLSRGMTGLLLTLIALLLLVTVVYWVQQPNDAAPARAQQIPASRPLLMPTPPPTTRPAHREKLPQPAEAPLARSIHLTPSGKEKAAVVEITKGRLPALPLIDTTKTAMEMPLTATQPDSLAEDQPSASKQVPFPLANDPMPALTKEEKELSEPESFITQEGYFGLSKDGMFGGRRWVKPLSRRISIVYGFAIKHPFDQPFQAMEGRPAFNGMVPELPLELRYYLLPKENRFTVFMYAQLRPSFASASLRLEVGTQARYRLWKSPRGASYFFVRLPMYQLSINPAWSGRPYPYSSLPTR
jgi:hypothetical protein